MSQQINPNAGMHVGMMPANAPGVHPGGLPQMPPMAGGGPGLAPNMVPIGNPNAQMNIPPPQGQGSHSGGHSGGGGGGGSHASQQDNLIYKVRLLIAQLKKSLGDLIEISAHSICHNSNMDNGIFLKEDQNIPRFDRAMEDFYSLCNQIELTLRTILECTIQTRDSTSYLPFQISKDSQSHHEMPPAGMAHNTISYSEYLGVIKKQVSYAKAVYDILSDAARQIKNEPPQQPPMQQMPSQQQQQLIPPQMNPHGIPMQQQQQMQPNMG